MRSGRGSPRARPSRVRLLRFCGVALLASVVGLAGCGGGGGGSGGGAGGGGGGGGGPGPGTPSDLPALPRPANGSCLAFDRPMPSVAMVAEPAFPSLAFNRPVAMERAPGDPRWFVLDLTGGLSVFEDRPDAASARSLLRLADIRGGSPARWRALTLFSITFHPAFPAVPELYLYYIAELLPGGNFPCDRVLVLSRFTVADDRVLSASEEVLITMRGPSLDPACPLQVSDHSGGLLAFGPDGYLYLSTGDSGVHPVDADHHALNPAQRLDSLLGKLLRLDVDSVDPVRGLPYGIPPDNPFADSPGCGAGRCAEIFASGFRNPWRGSIEASSGQIWLGDVGWASWEEVDQVLAGGDYGWPTIEGPACVPAAPGCDPATTASLPPVLAIPRQVGQSVIGGYVYRGATFPELQGTFIYADWVTGEVSALFFDPAGDPAPEVVLASGLPIVSFTEDRDGELYVLTTNLEEPGGVYRLVRAAAGSADPVPARLSATGCVDPAAPLEPASGLVAYDVNSPLWSDAADKDRWMALPDGTRIEIDAASGEWSLPVGSVLVKRFSLDGEPVEVRLLVRHDDGEWAGYTYEWDTELGDGVLLAGAKTKPVGDTVWTYPSRSECLRCHTGAAGRVLGLENGQLNRVALGPDGPANQLTILARMGMLRDPALVADPAAVERWADPADPGASLEARARSYLHANCAHCHRPGGPTVVDMDLRHQTPLASARVCDVPPLNSLGLANVSRLRPGDPDRSVLWLRLFSDGAERMPPLATRLADAVGVEAVGEWIRSLDACR